jgi:AcrR family transcriptional regulator
MALPEPPARRDRRAVRRHATIEEIKETARRQMAEEGTASITLRAIGREMGITASALYRYFASREALITALVKDAYDSFGAAVERAIGEVDADDHASQWLAAAYAYRQWALDHPTEFALILGPPIPGYHAPTEVTRTPALRHTSALGGVLARAWHAERLHLEPAAQDISAPLAAQLTAFRERRMLDLPLPVLAQIFSAFGVLQGVVTREVFGHLRPGIADGEALFDHEMVGLLRRWGLR